MQQLEICFSISAFTVCTLIQFTATTNSLVRKAAIEIGLPIISSFAIKFVCDCSHFKISLPASGTEYFVFVYIYIYIYIYGPKRNEVTSEWRKLHNKELNDLYSSPSMFRVIRSSKMR